VAVHAVPEAGSNAAAVTDKVHFLVRSGTSKAPTSWLLINSLVSSCTFFIFFSFSSRISKLIETHTLHALEILAAIKPPTALIGKPKTLKSNLEKSSGCDQVLGAKQVNVCDGPASQHLQRHEPKLGV